MNIRRLFTIVAVLIAFASTGFGKAGTKPNIIYIMADDLGYADFGFNGQQIMKTPRIDQMRKELDMNATVAEQVAGPNEVIRIGDQTVRVESFLDKWGFPARMQSMPVSKLSGGERNRVLLAQLLCAGGNLLELDEPTNDLDLSTLRALEEALMAFPGSVIVVSTSAPSERVSSSVSASSGSVPWIDTSSRSSKPSPSLSTPTPTLTAAVTTSPLPSSIEYSQQSASV